MAAAAAAARGAPRPERGAPRAGVGARRDGGAAPGGGARVAAAFVLGGGEDGLGPRGRRPEGLSASRGQDV